MELDQIMKLSLYQIIGFFGSIALDKNHSCKYNVTTNKGLICMKQKVIHSRLVKIGNSKGVRLPKTLLEMSGIKDEIQIFIDNGQIIICPLEKNNPRLGWQKSFQEMAQENHDQILDQEIVSTSSWDDLEWEW